MLLLVLVERVDEHLFRGGIKVIDIIARADDALVKHRLGEFVALLVEDCPELDAGKVGRLEQGHALIFDDVVEAGNVGLVGTGELGVEGLVELASFFPLLEDRLHLLRRGGVNRLGFCLSLSLGGGLGPRGCRGGDGPGNLGPGLLSRGG